MPLNKLKNLKIKLGAKSSRFVVDLKQDLTIAAKELKDQENSLMESKLEKLAELDYKKYFNKSKTKAKALIFDFGGSLSKLRGQIKTWRIRTSETKPEETAKTEPASTTTRNGRGWASLLNQLAFVVLIRLILVVLKNVIILFYKICYGAGWTIAFCLRLVYFLLLAITRPIIKAISSLTRKFKPLTAKGLNIISVAYKKTAGLASLVFRPWRGLAKIIKNRTRVKKNSVKDGAGQEEKISTNQDYPASAEALAIRQRGVLKPVLAFALVLLIIVLPVKAYTYYKTIDSAKGKVLGASESAMNNLIFGGRAAANLDFNQADISFTAAGDNFLVAQSQLEEINGLLFVIGSILPDRNIKLAAAGKHIINAGALSASAGKNLGLAFASLFNYRAEESGEILLDLNFYGKKAIGDLSELNKELDQINSQAIPDDYQEKFILLKQKTGELKRGLSEFIGLADKLKSFLGLSASKRYLLIFQNNSELRASGGFIGSFALMDISNGQIKNVEAPGGGSYDTDAGLLKKIKSPEPLRLVRADWHFWDANWWPDWSASAKKLAWFYENSDGSTVDGVIGFTPTVMEKILKVMGPIDLKEKYGVEINSDNFWRVTQEFAEQKPNVTKEPKKIIGDLMNKMIEELPRRLNKNNLVPLLKALEESLTDKNILFYFTDEELQAEAEALDWAGRIKETSGDYLNVVNTNIAGGKSDRRIKQQIIHQAQILPDGSVIDTLTIKRTHEGIKRELFSGVRNVDWLRIYVPVGSKLIAADGFKPVDKIFFKAADEGWQNDPEVYAAESLAKTDISSGTKIYDELGKTVFANWTQLDPGETIEINLKYQLPFKITDKKLKPEPGLVDSFMAKAGAIINPEQKNLYSYSMLLQKQPGMNSSTMRSELKLNDNFKPIWNFPSALTVSRDGWLRAENLDQDKLTALMVEEK